jgi:hypothetical protein
MLAETQTLRGLEAAARAELDAGCRVDLQNLARLTEAALRKAREELEGYLSSLGPLESTLASNLKREYSELVAQRCAGAAFANAAVRFRARFRNYAEALVIAERAFVEAVTSSDPEIRRRPKAPRRVAVPRIELDNERSIVPEGVPSLSDLDVWIEELAQRLHHALESTISSASRRTLDRGRREIARTSAAVRLAALATPAYVSTTSVSS